MKLTANTLALLTIIGMVLAVIAWKILAAHPVGPLGRSSGYVPGPVGGGAPPPKPCWAELRCENLYGYQSWDEAGRPQVSLALRLQPGDRPLTTRVFEVRALGSDGHDCDQSCTLSGVAVVNQPDGANNSWDAAFLVSREGRVLEIPLAGRSQVLVEDSGSVVTEEAKPVGGEVAVRFNASAFSCIAFYGHNQDLPLGPFVDRGQPILSE